MKLYQQIYASMFSNKKFRIYFKIKQIYFPYRNWNSITEKSALFSRSKNYIFTENFQDSFNFAII